VGGLPYEAIFYTLYYIECGVNNQLGLGYNVNISPPL